MSGHSKIGPSTAERWIACPGSVKKSEGLVNKPNEYAAQGTVAHSLAELLVTDKIDELELMAKVGTTVMQEGFEIEITDEMIDGVTLYRDTVQDDMVAMLKTVPGKHKPEFHHYAETKVHVKSVDEALWGTADYIQFIKGNVLKVYDFKFGRGVVEPTENPQAALYALGAMETIAGEVFDEIELVIIQPRAGHADGAVRRWKAPKPWLSQFRNTAHAAVLETKKPDAKLKAGGHCGWCPAKLQCGTRDEWVKNGARESAGADFDVVVPSEAGPAQGTPNSLPIVSLMSLEALAKAYSWREPIEDWFGDVADRIQTALANGEHVPGYKLVDGRANRKWIDEEKVVEEWAPLLPEGALFEHKLLSPAKLEKLPGVGKGKIDHLTFKPEAKKAIARDVDPRPKASSKAQDDFGVTLELTKKNNVVLTGSNDDLDAELLGVTPDAKKRDPMWPL